jgi:thioesterase domain-containing protein
MKSSPDKTISSPEDERRATGSEPDTFVMPATPCQTRFWLLHKMHPGNRSLNMPIAWTCLGNFAPDVAEAALTELVRRHESLRTTFEVVDGQLSQVIHPPFEMALPIEDLRPLPKEAKRRQADAIIQKQAHIQIDLEKGPLLVAQAIRMGVEEYILTLTIHHSVCDGWSNGVVLRDFAAIFDGLMRQVPAGLPELPIQFGDYAVWLDQWRKGNKSAESLDYWRGTLGGDFTQLQIKRDFQGGEVEEHGNIETLLLTPDLTRQARDFCAVRGITLYMLLLSVYAATLHRLTGQGDILIGTPCANRRPETENLIGPFSNPQVIRVKIGKEDTLGAIVESVRSWTLGALAHQDLPFEDLNDDEVFCRDRNQFNLQVYFIYQKAFMQAQKTPSLEIVPLRSVSPGTMFDLMLSIVERAEGPRLQLEYNSGFFRSATIQRILNLYVRILEAILLNVENPAGEVAKEESGQTLIADSNGHAEYTTAEETVNRNKNFNAETSFGVPANDRKGKDHVAPRDALEAQIAKIWETAIRVTNLSVRDSFFDLGGRSLAAMQIVSRINKTYSLSFGLASLFSGHTIERMAELVTKRLSANGSSSIVPMQPKGTAAPLFIIHGAGGNVIRFYQLAMMVGTSHPIYGIQAQSLLTGQPALLRLEDQAAFYLTEIRKIQPTGPYFFLGYSFGGTIALEIAHQLHALGERVELLGMLDSRQRDCIVVAQRDDPVGVRLDRRITRFLGNLSALSLRERIAYLYQKLFTRTLRQIYSLAATLGIHAVPSFMKSTDDITWVAAMNHHPRPWSEKITLFRASVQPDPRLPLDLGWTPFAEGGVEVIELPGDHDLVFREPNIQVMAAQLRNCLERSESDRSASDSSGPAKIHLYEPAAVAK